MRNKVASELQISATRKGILVHYVQNGLHDMVALVYSEMNEIEDVDWELVEAMLNRNGITMEGINGSKD